MISVKANPKDWVKDVYIASKIGTQLDVEGNEINVYENTDTLGATPKGINSNEICTEYGDRNRKIKMIKQTGKHSIK